MNMNIMLVHINFSNLFIRYSLIRLTLCTNRTSFLSPVSVGGMNRQNSKTAPVIKKVAPPTVPDFRHSGSSFGSAGYSSSGEEFISPADANKGRVLVYAQENRRLGLQKRDLLSTFSPKHIPSPSRVDCFINASDSHACFYGTYSGLCARCFMEPRSFLYEH